MFEVIEVGDTVQLTASTLLGIYEQDSEEFERILAAQRAGGTVTAVTDEAVSIDIGTGQPLTIDVNEKQRKLALQLVKKANVTIDDELADAPDKGDDFEFEFDINMPTSTPGDQIGPQVRMAQWAVVQILDLKKYAIEQDLQRIPDDFVGLVDPRSEHADKKNLRPVVVDLTDAEEALYTTALTAIKDFIKPPRETTHPELAAASTSSPIDGDSGNTPEPGPGAPTGPTGHIGPFCPTGNEE